MAHLFRAGARTLIGGGGVYIHIFGLCPTNFFNFKINFITKETSLAEPEYMNIHPPPANYRSSAGPALVNSCCFKVDLAVVSPYSNLSITGRGGRVLRGVFTTTIVLNTIFFSIYKNNI